MARLQLALFSLVVFISSSAMAADICVGGPKENWLKPEDFKRIVTELGHKDFVLAFEDNCFEAKIVDAEGNHIEIYMDPVTGEVVKMKNDGKS